MEKKKTLILTVGLPRSGKSTWARQQGYPMVNIDSIRLALTGKAYEPLAEEMVWATARIMVRALFISGHDIVIVDATNTTLGRRNAWKAKEWSCAYKVFTVGVDVCKQRAIDSGKPELVPVIERMNNGWECPATEQDVWFWEV
jgi:predicted kinase